MKAREIVLAFVLADITLHPPRCLALAFRRAWTPGSCLTVLGLLQREWSRFLPGGLASPKRLAFTADPKVSNVSRPRATRQRSLALAALGGLSLFLWQR